MKTKLPRQVRVDPAKLLLVDFVRDMDRGEPVSVVAILCRYVAVKRAFFAMEIISDPLNQEPISPYYVDRSTLMHDVRERSLAGPNPSLDPGDQRARQDSNLRPAA